MIKIKGLKSPIVNVELGNAFSPGMERLMGTVLNRAARLASGALRRWHHPLRSTAERRIWPRLEAAGLDPDYVRKAQAATFEKLEKACDSCAQVARCASDLEAANPTGRVVGYCPNTPIIDELVVARVFPSVPIARRPLKNQPELETPMQVKDAMHKDAVWLEATTTVRQLATQMRELDIGAIPIGEKDRLVGMVTDRDIAIRALANGTDVASLTARDVMTKGIVFCRDTEDLDDAVRIMEQKQIRRLPVLDENKRLVGMLSLGDVAHATSPQICAETLTAVSAHHA